MRVEIKTSASELLIHYRILLILIESWLQECKHIFTVHIRVLVNFVHIFSGLHMGCLRVEIKTSACELLIHYWMLLILIESWLQECKHIFTVHIRVLVNFVHIFSGLHMGWRDLQIGGRVGGC